MNQLDFQGRHAIVTGGARRIGCAIARAASGRDEAALFAESESEQAQIRKSQDFIEGPRAFIEKPRRARATRRCGLPAPPTRAPAGTWS